MVIFRTSPTFSLEPTLFQLGYLALVAMSPLVCFVPRIKKALGSLAIPGSVQLTVSILFAGLVVFLRSRMPNDGVFALTDMYFGEDNGGVIEVLAHSLRDGYTPYSSHLGEFINAAYLAAAGNITWFGDMGELGLLPALTHYNMTLLFMAWLPIAALSAVVFSGKKFTPPITIAVISVMTAVSALLFWPFVPLGHTSVISAGLFAMSLLAITLNRKLALDHPLLFISLITSLGLIVGNIWFPMMPFAAATVALAFLALLQVEYQKGNKKIVIALVSLFAGLGLLLLPTVLGLVLENSGLLQLQGGTRTPATGLVVIWLIMLATAIGFVSSKSKDQTLVGSKLFTLILVVLVVSNFYLLISGYLNNAGQLGYGATKYLLTSIAFTIPLLLIPILESVRKLRLLEVVAFGAVLMLIVLMVQPDSRKVPRDIVSSSNKSISESRYASVAKSLKQALDKRPDHVFCVADYGLPLPDSQMNFDSYSCNRWAGSINGDESLFIWGFVALGRAPKETLEVTRDTLEGKKVILIRLTDDPQNNLAGLDVLDTWWAEYVDPSWQIINVDW
jgi:hypothetical protein